MVKTMKVAGLVLAAAALFSGNGSAGPFVAAETPDAVLEEFDNSHTMASVEARLQQLDRASAEEARVKYISELRESLIKAEEARIQLESELKLEKRTATETKDRLTSELKETKGRLEGELKFTRRSLEETKVNMAAELEEYKERLDEVTMTCDIRTTALQTTISSLNVTHEEWKARATDLGHSYDDMQALVIDSKHEQLAAEMGRVAFETTSVSVESENTRLTAQVTELEVTVEGLRDEASMQADRIAVMMKQHFDLESQLLIQVSTLNRTEVLNVLLRENLHEARQRELTAESREMSRYTEAATLNVTVAELKALVARQEKDVVSLTEASDNKNAVLTAAAKKTVGLQEKLIELAGKLEVAKIILEKYLTPAQIKYEEEKYHEWQGEAQATAVAAATAALATEKAALEWRIVEAESAVAHSDVLSSELSHTLKMAEEKLYALEDKYDELSKLAHSNEPLRHRVREAHEHQQRLDSMSYARAEAVRVRLASLDLTNKHLLAHIDSVKSAMTTIEATAKTKSAQLMQASAHSAQVSEILLNVAGTLSSCDIRPKAFQEEVHNAIGQWDRMYFMNESLIDLEQRNIELTEANEQAWALIDAKSAAMAGAADDMTRIETELTAAMNELRETKDQVTVTEGEIGLLKRVVGASGKAFPASWSSFWAESAAMYSEMSVTKLEISCYAAAMSMLIFGIFSKPTVQK
mmetsp:Transcript_17493/g.45513  ORF Transcript_17493/g.45513 Transcript_17493/m.45513 type:complete len:700 (+) Transcript_17493:123-2222(+)